MSTLEAPPQFVRISGSTFSLRVIAAAIILLFAYYAAGVVITVLLSILLAYLLDPAVEFLERVHLPRTLGAMIAVLVLIAALAAIGYALSERTADFVANWPKYGSTLRQVAATVEGRISGFEKGVSDIDAGSGDSSTSRAAQPRPADQGILHTLILRGIGSLYALILEATFVPFLVFFMLAGKREVWHGTLQLFPVAKRTQVKETLEDLRAVLRGYLAGMTMVTAMVIGVSSLFFWLMGMDYPVLTGIVSGLLNMVPYIGVVMAWLPAFVIALAKWKTFGSFALIAGILTGIHVLALNLVAPELVGRRVQLNAVAITISLLFWGWVWGGMGLLLAIPITATLRVICDHTESWRPIGRWLSA